MHCLASLLIVAILGLSSLNAGEKKNEPQREKPPFTTLSITYKLSGTKTGLETIYFDAVKNKVTIEENSELRLGNMTNRTRLVSIYEGARRTYMVAGDSRAVTVPCSEDITRSFYGEPSSYDQDAGTVAVLGRECQVFASGSGKTCYWQGILMKEVPNGTYGFAREAVIIELNTALAPEKFLIPAGVRIMTLQDVKKEEDKTTRELKKSLEERAATDPDLQQVLKASLKKNGDLDMGRYYKEMKKYEKKKKHEDL